MHRFTDYWNRGVRNVPDMTGAAHLLDARDLKAVMTSLGLELPLRMVLDVGCGTGRLAQLVEGYTGVDIAPDMVAYTRKAGYDAELIAAPTDLAGLLPPGDRFGLVTCISVFTHIDRIERQMYLSAFHAIAPQVVVDIIPGDGAGDVAKWTAVPADFELDAVAAGFRIVQAVDQAWDMNLHRYYRLEVE